MVHDSFGTETKAFTRIIDFIRFGISQAGSANLYYGHGTDNARDDIFSLILGLLSLPWDVDPLLLQAQLSPSEIKIVVEGLEKRIIQRIPVPYITKSAFFCDKFFYVDERVLIPRSPIAELIKQQFSPWVEADSVSRVLDLCTGSACIAIACCDAFPDAQVDAIDISADALAVAAMNRDRYHLQDQLMLIQSDCFEQLTTETYDIIVSNPPYVSHEDVVALPKEYQWEPAMALEADDLGLAIVKRIIKQASKYLKEEGILVIELGLNAEALTNAYPDLPFLWLEFEHGGEGVFVLTAQQLRDHDQGL